MLTGQELEVRGEGAEVRLTNHVNTDDVERANWAACQDEDRGFIRGKHGEALARRVLSIPNSDAAMLYARQDYDWLAWQRGGDERALHRLAERFPYWRSSGGGF